MAGAWTTMTVKDGGGTSRTMRVWDESGAGTGPFSFGQFGSDGAGGGGKLALDSSLTAGVKLLDKNGTNQAIIDSHGSQQTTLVDSSGNAAALNANQTADYAKSVGAAPVMLPKDQVVPNSLQSVSNGTTASRVNAAASTNATSLKASAGNIVNIDVFNVAAYSVFLKLYNKASAPTVGTDTPVWTIPIATGTGYSKHFQYGKNFATGIAYAITKLQADSDTTVVAAGDLTGSIDWI